MKTTLTSTSKTLYQKAGMLLLFMMCFYSITVPAQGNRHQGDGGGSRQSTVRQPSVHQRAPNIDRSSSQARTPGNTRINPDRGSRINNNNRPGINTDRTANNRPNNNFNRPGNSNNRPGNNTYNRPGNNSNRPGYGNRPGNNFNNGYRGGYNRYNSYRRPVYNARNPNWRYAYAPRRNSIFNTLPSSYFSINFGGFGYRYYDGIFYRPYNNVFRVVAPPLGIFVNVLPFGYSRIYVHDYPYYYYNGTYYDYRDNNYTVVSPPVGAIVESIPDGYETVTIDGETYYVVDGAQYKPVTQDNGEIWYEVIKAN
ncbi:MAG: DUF6515 family protein [Ferruginibacter sp.]